MAHYLVRAEPREDRMAELRELLESGEIREMEPFGRALERSLEDARWDPETEEAAWEELDYCSPPLAQERDAVLDDHFREIRVERVEEGDGWDRIADLPSLWDRKAD